MDEQLIVKIEDVYMDVFLKKLMCTLDPSYEYYVSIISF